MADTFLVMGILALNLWMAWHAIRMLPTALGTKSRIPRDVSAAGIPLPPDQSLKGYGITQLGFGRLGEAQVKLPMWPAPETVWVFIHSQGDVIAELSHSIVAFSTYYGNRRHEMTFYPTGERIRSEEFIADYVDTSLQDAYEAHRQRLQAVPPKFGTPTQVSSMEDYIRLDIIWRRILGSRLHRRFMILDIAIIGAALYSLALVLFVALVSDWLEYLARGVFPSLRPLLILLLPVVLIMAIRMTFNIQIAQRIRRAG